MSSPAHPRHYVAVDLARLVAALVVAVWHYQHFWMPEAGAHLLTDRADQPLYAILWPAYHVGLKAVEFFWIISGFVFCHVYWAQPTSPRAFVVARFARLYPLHLATLLLVAGLQIISVAALGHEQIYPHNDVWHFVLNLVLASHWGLQEGWSFNAPIWSVSVEVLVYVGFLAVLIWLPRHALSLVGAAAVSAGAWLETGWSVWLCGTAFFAGAGLQRLVLQLARPDPPVRSVGVGLILWLVCLVAVDRFPPDLLLLSGMALVILLCGLADHVLPGDFARFRAADLTYGIYLLHVPLQITALIIMQTAGLDHSSLAASPLFLAGYLASVVGLSAVVFRWIEAPARQAVRMRFATRAFPHSSRVHQSTTS